MKHYIYISINDFLNEKSEFKDYFILYHSTDSDFLIQ
jgi:hypothetical protein